jgi:hypothetical protein
VASALDGYLGHPARLSDADEFAHRAPESAGDRLWGDTVWLSAMDPAAGIRGVNHIHLTNRGYARFQAHYWIDGVRQSYACRAPAEQNPVLTRWSDGRMSYEVLEPFRRVRLTLDAPRFGFDLEYESRFPAFDYEDCAGGNPLWILKPVAGVHGGHYELATRCRGTFEIREGPDAGQTRTIDSLGHRDHTWSDRFASLRGWDDESMPDTAMHFWLILQFPERDLHGVGFFDPAAFGATSDNNGRAGCESGPRGNRLVLDVAPVPEYAGTATASAYRTGGGPSRWRFTLDGGEVLHVRATRRHATLELMMRGENDAENPLSDYQDIVDLEIEETGERGYGAIEYSVLPGRPRWLR